MTESSSAAPVIAVIAGEHSGDLLGAGMLRELRRHHPDAEFIGVGGPLMQAEGLTSLVPMDDLAVMGIAEVLGRLFTLLSHRRKLVKHFKAVRPAVFVGIDAPDFNLPVARMLKAEGIPTVHYVSPSVWAWRQGRIKGIKAAVDHVLCLLPFEKAFYDEHDLPATFVGHPLADAIPPDWSKSEARAELGIDARGTVVAILPGSRAGEVARLGPVFLQAAALLAEKNPQLQFIAPMISTQRAEQFRELQQQYAPGLSVKLLEGQSRTAMAAADALLLTSGTVTLEAMLIKRPMVVAYKFNWLTHKLIQRLFKAAFFSLPNLLAGRELVPELVQQQVTPERLAAAVQQQLSQPTGPLVEAFTALHQQLQHDADQVSARVVAEVGNLTSYPHGAAK